MWDKQTGAVRQVPVKDVGFQRHLYTMPTEMAESFTDAEREVLPDGWDDEFGFERMFSYVEGNLATLLDVIQEHKVIPPKGSPALDNLIVALVVFDLRTPAKMEQARTMIEAMMNIMGKEAMDADPEWQGKTFTPVSVPFKTNKHQLIGYTLVTGFQPLVETMRERNWSLLVTDPGSLAIADHPVNITFARQPAQDTDIAAPAVPNTLVMFPLADDLLLAGELETESGVYEASERWAGYHNTVALSYAERYVFTKNDSFPMLTDGKRLPAYDAVGASTEKVFTMTPELFSEAVADGRIRKPRRVSVNGKPVDEMLAAIDGTVIGDEPSDIGDED